MSRGPGPASKASLVLNWTVLPSPTTCTSERGDLHVLGLQRRLNLRTADTFAIGRGSAARTTDDDGIVREQGKLRLHIVLIDR